MHGCYSVGMEYATVSKVGDELCVAEAAALPGHVEDHWCYGKVGGSRQIASIIPFKNISRS